MFFVLWQSDRNSEFSSVICFAGCDNEVIAHGIKANMISADCKYLGGVIGEYYVYHWKA